MMAEERALEVIEDGRPGSRERDAAITALNEFITGMLELVIGDLPQKLRRQHLDLMRKVLAFELDRAAQMEREDSDWITDDDGDSGG